MRFPLALLPMALCGLATIVAVAVILVTSDLLRRFVLLLITRLDRRRPARRIRSAPVSNDTKVLGGKPPPEPAISPSETLPG